MASNQFSGFVGAQKFPVPEIPEEEDDGFAGEPGLRVMAKYFQAYINFYAAQGYESIAWDERKQDGGIIKYIFGHNPREGGEGFFRGTQTGALYVFRMGSKDGIYDMAEDEHVIVSDIMCVFVSPPDDSPQLAQRYPFVAGILPKLVSKAINRRRDPCFVLPEDTDARKSWRGTHAWRAAAFDKVEFKEFRRSEVEVKDAESDGSWRYIAFDMIIQITERERNSAESDENDAAQGLDLRVSEDVPPDNVMVFPEYLRRLLLYCADEYAYYAISTGSA
jgi:hypothetical protein